MIISHTLRTYIQPFYCVIIVMHLGWQRRFVPLHRNCENHWSGLFPTFFVIHTLSFQHISRLQSTLYLFSFLVDVQFMKQRKGFFFRMFWTRYTSPLLIFLIDKITCISTNLRIWFILMKTHCYQIVESGSQRRTCCRRKFSPVHFRHWKCFVSEFFEVFSWGGVGGVLLWQVGVASDFDLAPVRGQAFIWTNGGAN